MKEIIDVVHKSIYPFFDVCGDGEEEPLSDKDKLLLSVNKAICNNLKALEQEYYGDYINKHEVLHILKEKWNMFSDADDAMQESIDTIEALSPVTPAEKTGHWILGGYDDNYYICDKCSYKASEYYFKPRYKFCPNCGAKMVEDTGSEE